MDLLNQTLSDTLFRDGRHKSSSLLASIAITLGISFLYFLAFRYQLGPYSKYRDLPPGPPSNVLTGTPNYVTHQPHIWYKELSRKYGPIVSIWKGQNLHMVLNTAKDIKELCDKRGNIYSSRPKMFVFHDIIFHGMFIASCPYNESWRRQRKIITTCVGPRALKNLQPYQEYEARQYMRDLLDSPENFYHHAERFGTSILTSTVYGYRAHDIMHPSALSLLMMGSWMEHKMHPTRYVDDNWPILQRLPRALAPWRKQYYKDAELLLKMAKAWWEPCKARVQAGIDIPCFATGFVKSYEADGWNNDEAALVTVSLLLAGAGTTGATLNFFIMGCCTNPEAVKEAHEELDCVVGDKRLPTAADEPNLPYIRAMIKEGLRWRPFSNQGFHHATSKDDVYQGYRIPAGTRIIPNAYSIHMDESKYPDPDTYEPMRYINYTLSATEAVNLKDGEQRGHFGYGAGRRVCAGMYVAEASLFIAVSKLLWTFNISYAKDESGQDILIDTMGYDGGLFGKPQPYKAKLEARSPERAAIVRKEFAEAKTDVRSLADESNDGKLGTMEELVEILKKDPDVTIH